ncbi:MAG: SRPBCC family protein [Planctomycetota bacterium]
MLELSFAFRDSLVVPGAPPERAFALLQDVPDSLAHFPKLDVLRRLPDGSWRWEMNKIGLGRFSVQVAYGVRYTHHEDERRISWEPVPGAGNAAARGTWTLEPAGSGTRMILENRLDVRFERLPGVVRRVVEPLAALENRALIRAYMDNLGRTLGGRDGRLRPRWPVDY